MREDRSLLDFLDCDYTFLNERLARHYGMPGVTGEDLPPGPPQGGQRGGLITQASVLTVTSNPTRTSPVKRGKWVLEQILGTPPPAAAAERAPARRGQEGRPLGNAPPADGAAPRPTRAAPTATAALIRPASAWRTTTPSAPGATRTASFPIDASGKLPGGRIVPRAGRAEGDPQDPQRPSSPAA